jgi:cytochrome c
MKIAATAALSLMAFCAPALAADVHGSPAEAKAMLQKAVTHYKDVGRTQALADFTAKKAPFGDRDLYVYCIDAKHTLVANGGFPEYVSLSADLVRDADGKSIGKAGWDIASQKGEGELHYTWFNPETKLAEPKIAFFARAGEDVCGVGAYHTP